MTTQRILDKIAQALPGEVDDGTYDSGFRCALESVVLALTPHLTTETIDEVIQTTLDALGNA